MSGAGQTPSAEEMKKVEAEAIIRALDAVGRFVVSYGEIVKALLEIGGGQIEEQLYEDVRSNKNFGQFFVYWIWSNPADASLDLFAVSPRALEPWQVDVLETVAELRGMGIRYDYIHCAVEYGAIREVIHNLIKMWTRTELDDFIDRLKTPN
jgi:hypothetical protein